MEESGAAAKKFGMSMASGKGQEKKQQDNRLSMMLQRQAQVAKAKASGALGAPAGAGAKRKPEKTVEVSVDDLLADFDAPAPVPKKKQSTLPRGTKVLLLVCLVLRLCVLICSLSWRGPILWILILRIQCMCATPGGGTACRSRRIACQRQPLLTHGQQEAPVRAAAQADTSRRCVRCGKARA